jgi:hypothetical protein
MRKSFWMIPVALLIAALGGTSALADGVDVFNAGGQVTAIDGITLNGSLYNVTFTSTIDNTFSAYPALQEDGEVGAVIFAVDTAIDADLGTNFINDPAGAGQIQVYCVALASSRSECATSGNDDPYFWEPAFDTSTAYAASLVAGNPEVYSWANFTPAVVTTPEPGTLPLTLAGVGLLGLLVVIRKRGSPSSLTL